MSKYVIFIKFYDVVFGAIKLNATTMTWPLRILCWKEKEQAYFHVTTRESNQYVVTAFAGKLPSMV